MIDEFKMGTTEEVAEPEVIVFDETISDITNPARVILFNDDWHTFEEVIIQLIKAIKCTSEQAEALAMETHSKGKSCVFEGDLNSCLRVSSILEEIALHTQIEY